jgi:signal transduction histidine kinase
VKAAARGSPRRLPAILGAASVAAIATLVPVYRLQNLSWSQAVAAAVLFVLTCVVLGWVVWHILAKQRDVASWVQLIVRHLLMALAFSAAWTASFSAFAYLIAPPESMTGYLRGGAVWQFVWGIGIYAALAVAAGIHRRLKEQELAAAAAELQALRAQLNPHFLFNTLHSLTQLAREDPVATQDALERFGGLMRYVLSAGRNAIADVSLEEEIGFVRDYLAVERLRLGERLRVLEDIDPDALELAVPPLLLQPLVENAVRHGIAPRRDGGTIRLTARATGSLLAIEIADDGNDAEPDDLSQSTGLGLHAVRRQLNARFSGKGALEIATRPGAGFTARVTIPARVPAAGSR